MLLLRALGLLSAQVLVIAQQNCTKCPGDSGQTCCGKYNVCCKGDGWSCIAADESCCGGTACIRQTTYCCPPTDNPSCSGGKCPARCCPRWTVCCAKGGRDGCCHPFEAVMAEALAVPPTPPPAATPNPDDGAPRTLFAMFLEAGAFAEPLKVLTIDTTTGHATSKVVHGYDTHGENTRIFEFSRASGSFVTFELDYSAPPDAQGRRTLHMYAVHPADGATDKAEVRCEAGPCGFDFPTGYKHTEACPGSGHPLAGRPCMVLATGPEPTGGGDYPAGNYAFFAVESRTASVAVAHPISTLAPRPGADPLAGWMHALSRSGTAYRCGFRNVSAGTDLGLGWTKLGNSSASSGFGSDAAPASHGAYLTLDASSTTLPGARGDLLYSMAPRDGLQTSIDLIVWSQGRAPKVVAALGDAHQPALFGDVAATMIGRTWAGLTVQHPGVVLNGGWALSVVANVSSAAPEAALLPLVPRVGGGTCSLSGIGFPSSAAVV